MGVAQVAELSEPCSEAGPQCDVTGRASGAPVGEQGALLGARRAWWRWGHMQVLLSPSRPWRDPHLAQRPPHPYPRNQSHGNLTCSGLGLGFACVCASSFAV